MDYRELATKIREKHPGAYDDMDDAALARAIVTKYPAYSDVTFDEPAQQPEKPSIWGTVIDASRRALGTFFPQASTLAEKTTEFVTDPVGTLKQAPSAAAGAASAFVPGGPAIRAGASMLAGAGGKAYEIGGRRLFGDQSSTTPTIPFTNKEIQSIPGIPKEASDIAVEGAVQGAFEIPGAIGKAAQNAAPGMARRALGFQKSQLTSTKSWRESLRKMATANRSAEEMLKRDVIPFSGSPEEMAKRATKVMDQSGSAMNDVVKQMDSAGVQINPDDVGTRLIDELKPEYGDQNKIVETLLDDLEVFRKNPTVQKARELKTRWAKTGFEDRTVGSEASKIYRKASAILDDTIGQTIATVDPAMGDAFRKAQRVYGTAFTAMKGIGNKLGMEQGNMLIGLPSHVIAAGQLGTGNVAGAAATLGIVEAFKRRGSAAAANTLFNAGKAKDLPGPALRTMDAENRQKKNQAKPTKTFTEIIAGSRKVYADTGKKSREIKDINEARKLPVGTKVVFQGRRAEVIEMPVRDDLHSGKYSKDDVKRYLAERKKHGPAKTLRFIA